MQSQSENESKAESEAEQNFREQAELKDEGIIREFWTFLRENKKWWLVPLVGSLLLLGLVSFFAATAAAPFIYTIF